MPFPPWVDSPYPQNIRRLEVLLADLVPHVVIPKGGKILKTSLNLWMKQTQIFIFIKSEWGYLPSKFHMHKNRQFNTV